MRVLIISLLAICNLAAYSQLNSITGRVIDENDLPLQAATVALLNPMDSTLAYFGITNPKGEFSIGKVKSGTYLRQVAYFGYITSYQQIAVPHVVEKQTVVKLLPNVIELESAVVRAEVIPIQFKSDTVEFNAAAFKTNPDAVAEDLLKKLPGVEVDRAGNIKAMGENVNRVLVDGKEFFSNDPKVATKNLPAESVSKVQVYDKKSDESELLGIDDSEYSKTINIVLKDNMKKAVFGDVKAGADAMDYYQGNAKVYRFTDKHQVAALGMLNNVNRVGFSFRDYIDFNGGIRNLMGESGGSFSFSGDGSIPVDMGQPSNGSITSGAGGANYSYEISKNNLLNVSYMANGSSKTIIEDVYSNQFAQSSSFEQKSKDEGLGNNLNHLLNMGWRNKASKNQHFMLNGIATIANSESSSNTLTHSFANQTLANTLESNSRGQSKNVNGTLNGSWLKRLSGKWLMVKAEGWARYTQSINDNSWLNSFTLVNMPQASREEAYSDGQSISTSYSSRFTGLRRLGSNLFVEPSISIGYSTDLLMREQGLQGDVKTVIDSVSPRIDLENSWVKPKLMVKSNIRKSKVNFGIEYELYQQGHTLNHAGRKVNNANTLHPLFSWQYEIKSGHRLSLDYKSQSVMPTPRQLQPIISTSNPIALQYGNRNLTHEHRQTLSLSWLLFDQFSFTSVFANASASYTTNKIGNSISISEGLKQTYTLVNVPYDYTANGMLSFSTPIRLLKLNVNINLREQASRTLSIINNSESENLNLIHGVKVRFDNRGKKKWDISFGGDLNLTDTRYSIQRQLNRIYYSYSAFSDIRFTPTQAWNVKLSTDITSYNSQSFERSVTVPLVSAEVSYHFMANRRAVLSLECYDILNKNTGLTRSSGLNYLREVQSNTIGRYFMLSFKYKLNKFSNEGGGIVINAR